MKWMVCGVVDGCGFIEMFERFGGNGNYFIPLNGGIGDKRQQLADYCACEGCSGL